ncbi:MAG: hypothetical protein MUF30_06260, partial [Burkholderiales bacterium]|nr:hypothetical protein [Burkholderiales bacterium]
MAASRRGRRQGRPSVRRMPRSCTHLLSGFRKLTMRRILDLDAVVCDIRISLCRARREPRLLPMKTLSRLFCALAFAVAVASPALADDVKARAEQNPDTLVVNTDPGATVSASVPSTAGSGASATTTRTRIDLSIDGDGATATTAFGAQGFNRSDYVLIWLDDGSVLTAGEADAFDLAFNFRAAGFMDVRAVSLSRASVLVDVQVIATTGERFRTGVVEVFGPTGDLVIGDAAYVGAFDQRFSLVHASDATGVLAMEAQGSAANA